jgi:hypothetical protein
MRAFQNRWRNLAFGVVLSALAVGGAWFGAAASFSVDESSDE